jgi:hypothetical protein|tara:strand:- start:93 stop:344 length:252 start_codon:yes stop_codon:yes gene_type:complete
MSKDNNLKNYFPTAGARSTINLSKELKSNYQIFKSLLLLSYMSLNVDKKSGYLKKLNILEKRLSELEIARAKKEINESFKKYR